MDELNRALIAAAEELQGEPYLWAFDCDDLADSEFVQILVKHVGPLVSTSLVEQSKLARIAVLRAELNELEATQ